MHRSMLRASLLAAALLLALQGCRPAEPPAASSGRRGSAAGAAERSGTAGAAGVASAASVEDIDDVTRVILADLNAERRRAGTPPLKLDPRLSRVARERALAVERSGELRLDGESKEEVRARFERAGYAPAQWVEGAVTSNSDVTSMIGQWKRRERSLFREVMDEQFQDVGIGVARLDGMPLYLLLFAQSRGERFARETAGLSDRSAIRAAMLRRVNAERRRAGAGSLRHDERLDRAAQRHAEDMLARGFFAHESPEGKRPRDRAVAAGYRPRGIAENIAAGQSSVDEVMDGWMDSPGHRKNLLNAGYRDLGVGLALGRGGNGEQVIWVQEFGSER